MYIQKNLSELLLKPTITGCLVMCCLLLSSCISFAPEPTIINYSYAATDQLIENLVNKEKEQHNKEYEAEEHESEENEENEAEENHKKHPLTLDKKHTILVTSFVELSELKSSSDIGRLLAEQIASRINQKGYKTVEIKLAQEMYVKEKAGEFALSRSLAKISNQHEAQAMVVGTYTMLTDMVYVNVKIVHAESGYVYSAHDFAIPKDIIYRYDHDVM